VKHSLSTGAGCAGGSEYPVARMKGFALNALITMALMTPGLSSATEIRVATASNFRSAMTVLVREFGQASEHRVVPVYGSTGKHFAQIINGAPFDAFFAADTLRPERLEQDGLVVPGSRFTYARGRLVLWSPRAAYIDDHGDILAQGNFRHLAIANPELAPYGAAARDVLRSLGLWQELSERLVQGENIGQAFLFVRSGNAELGFVAWSQLVSGPQPVEGSFWQVPENLYRPVNQQAVVLTDNEATRAFMSFMHSEEAARIIRDHGYATPTIDLP
jgi:molybdate transport system substrate-binding protein